MSKRPYIVAHRGVSASYPENTHVAFQAAVDLGADWIELDVVPTADGVLMVSHDTTADRCTNGSGQFKQMTLKQVQKLDAGIGFDERFAGERIPTLNEVIDLIETTSICLNIEIKGDTPEDFVSTAYATVLLLQKRNFLRNVSIASFDPACLRAVRELEPLLTTNLDPTPQDGSLTPWELCQQCLRCGANFMGYNYERLTRAHVEEARQHGLALWTWTINDESSMRQAAVLGADAILSDDIVLLKTVLAEES